jgi:hypothetical protein
MIVAQLVDGQATFAICKGWVEILPIQRNTAAYLLQEGAIFATHEQRPLQEILQDLSDESGLAIDLDPNVGDKAATALSVMFRNCSLEDALVRVTELAQLKFVVLNHSVFVTTPERTKILEKEEEIRKKKRESYAPNSEA